MKSDTKRLLFMTQAQTLHRNKQVILTHLSFCLPGESGAGWSHPTIPPGAGHTCLHTD